MSLASTHIDGPVQDGPPTLETVVNFLRIFMTFQITQHKRWNVAAAIRTGHTKDSYGLGGLAWRSLCFTPHCVPSSPLASGQWAFLGAFQGPTQPFNPWPDLVSDWGLVEVRGVPHARPLVSVRYSGMVSQVVFTRCKLESEFNFLHKVPFWQIIYV